jgi:ATP-dependent RNA helicase DeaD
MAETLLERAEAEDVICALLKNAYKEELEAKSYQKIRKVQLEKNGKTRLFIALGKDSGMNVKKLIAFIQNEVKIESRVIRDIKVLESFSFVTLPFKEAEMVLAAFKKKKKGRKAIVEKANAKGKKK